MNDYVSVSPTYSDDIFLRTFSVPLDLYFLLKQYLLQHRTEFWKHATNRLGYAFIPTYPKILSSIRILGKLTSADSLVCFIYLSEETIRKYVALFFIEVIDIYSARLFSRFQLRQRFIKLAITIPKYDFLVSSEQ